MPLRPDSCVGVIADTHGLLRPQVLMNLKGCSHIIHAGDVGDPEVLRRLRALAPVTVVRGNVDHGAWAGALPQTDLLDFAGVNIYVLHILEELDLDPKAAGVSVVIYGHSHRPELNERNGVLFLNPGSVGPRRFSLPISMAYLRLETGRPRAQMINLE